jgi:hypothetical protein
MNPSNRPAFAVPVVAALLLAAPLLAVAGAHGARHAPRAQAGTQPSLPAWEQLTPAQRDLLVAPLRERWDASPADRARMYDHARRWREMTPAQRVRARRGLGHWEHMDPARRREMRALFEQMRPMTEQQRTALRDRWHAMTQAQRDAWVEAHAPKDPR